MQHLFGFAHEPAAGWREDGLDGRRKGRRMGRTTFLLGLVSLALSSVCEAKKVEENNRRSEVMLAEVLTSTTSVTVISRLGVTARSI